MELIAADKVGSERAAMIAKRTSRREPQRRGTAHQGLHHLKKTNPFERKEPKLRTPLKGIPFSKASIKACRGHYSFSTSGPGCVSNWQKNLAESPMWC